MQPRTTLSIEAIRSHFPALERVHNGHRVAYFDGPAERRFREALSRR